MSDEQPRLFDPERYSSITVAAWLLVPQSAARTLAVASALGRWHHRTSSFAPVRHSKDVDCVVIASRQRDRIRAVLGMTSPTSWRKFVHQMVGLNLAHICERGVVTLWLKPLEDPCPNCGKDTELLALERKTRAHESERQSLKERKIGAENVPNSGAANGAEEGDVGVQPSISSNNAWQGAGPDLGLGHAGVSKKRAGAEPEQADGDSRQGTEAWCLRCQRYGPGHPGDHAREWATMRRGAW